jgi:Ribbon-helix-helix protein, copG family
VLSCRGGLRLPLPNGLAKKEGAGSSFLGVVGISQYLSAKAMQSIPTRLTALFLRLMLSNNVQKGTNMTKEMGVRDDTALTDIIAVRLPRNLVERLEAQAARELISRADLVRRTLHSVYGREVVA